MALRPASVHKPYVRANFVRAPKAAEQIGLHEMTFRSQVMPFLNRLVVLPQIVRPLVFMPNNYLDDFLRWRKREGAAWYGQPARAAEVYADQPRASHLIRESAVDLEQALTDRLIEEPEFAEPVMRIVDVTSLLGFGKGVLLRQVRKQTIMPINPDVGRGRGGYVFGADTVRSMYQWQPPGANL